TYFEAAECVADLLDDPETAKRWDDPSALEGLSVGGLAGHLTMGITSILRLLDGPEVADAPVVGVGQYAASFKMEAFDADIHRYLRDKAAHSAAYGPERTTARFREMLVALRDRLPTEPGDRILDMRPILPWAITLDNRLRLHLWDLVVHLDDLAVSLGRPGAEAPQGASTVAITVMLEAARSQHGDRSVIRVLSRRERSAEEIFPVV
ncbi:MAG: maleylpyruvate isomerase N-terminal domain-containing protein, partial [Actinobacteria bacterium]|nr:maleylpyruvate isomerase N-terminal domain-containing protein [Actinomycetota bacterium]